MTTSISSDSYYPKVTYSPEEFPEPLKSKVKTDNFFSNKEGIIAKASNLFPELQWQ